MRSPHPSRIAAFAALFILFATIAMANAPVPGLTITPRSEVAPGELLIQLTPDAFALVRPEQLTIARTGLADLDRRLADIGAVEIAPALDLTTDAARKSAFGMDRIFSVHYAGGVDPQTAARSFAGSDEIVFAEPNWIAHAMLAPNDTYYPSQWAHNNTGQAIKYGGGNVGTVDCDTDTDQAWDLQTGSAAMIIAIIDTGVDLGHPEFAGRLVSGYDYANNDSNPTDDNGHGTCCAGIAAGAGNNAQGVAGVAWGARIMPVKVLDANGSGTYTAVANGMNFAADNGAKILSMSLGGPASSTLLTAVNYAYGRGCAIFAAAGNGNASSLDYPGAYSNVIAIGALSPCNERKSTTSCDGEYWWGSNYGTGLDFMAPGVRIHTADIRGSGGFGTGDYISDFNGTSSATPHAAGIGALVWSQNPALTNATLLSVLQGNCDDMGAAGYDTQTGYGRMNAYRAVQNAAGGGPPAPVTLFSEGFEINTVPGSVWSATDANSTSGLDYWGDQSTGARVHGGSWSAYCADNSNVSGQRYDNNMNADMTLINPVSLSGYTGVQLSFWIWYRTSNSSDYLSFQVLNGSTWTEIQRWSGSSSTWRNLAYSVTGSALKFRFVFFSNGSATSEGAYVDDISLVGTPIAFAPPDGPTILALMDETGESEAPALATREAGPGLVATPNPFNPRTTLHFTLGQAGHVRLEVFSADGRRVRLLQDGILPAGDHEFAWHGADGAGHILATGVYYARLSIEGKTASQRRLLLLK
jgi:subtilisin family serine protease